MEKRLRTEKLSVHIDLMYTVFKATVIILLMEHYTLRLIVAI